MLSGDGLSAVAPCWRDTRLRRNGHRGEGCHASAVRDRQQHSLINDLSRPFDAEVRIILIVELQQVQVQVQVRFRSRSVADGAGSARLTPRTTLCHPHCEVDSSPEDGNFMHGWPGLRGLRDREVSPYAHATDARGFIGSAVGQGDCDRPALGIVTVALACRREISLSER